MPSSPPPQVDLYNIPLGFDMIADAGERECFQKIATSFNLPARQIDALRWIGGELLEQSDDFQRLVSDLGAQGDDGSGVDPKPCSTSGGTG